MDDISFCWFLWFSIIFKCINDNILRVFVKKLILLLWIDVDIIYLLNKKNIFWYKVKWFGIVFLKDKLRKLINKFKNLVEYKYYNYICDVSFDIYKNFKRFWFVFWYKIKFCILFMILKGLGEEVVSLVDKVNFFNRYFYFVFN